MAAAKRKLAPTDDNVKIPAAVLAASARSDEIHRAAYDTPAQLPADAPEIVADAAAVATGNAPVAALTEPVPAAPAVAAPAPVVTPPGNAASSTPATSDQSWEHRYSSMKGRFDRSETTNKQLIDRLNGLEQVIATMAVTAPIPAAPAELSAESLITAAEREAYGDEFISMAGKVAQEKFSPKVSQLENEVKNLRERLENVGGYVAQTERDRMHQYLTGACPNWLIVNDNDDFKDWLALPDVYTGAIKHTLLKAAYAANDAPRVLAFFQGFLSEEAALAPRPEPTLAEAALASPKVELASFAAPGRAKTSAAPIAPAEKPIFTRAQITQFYVDVSSKKYVGREDEKNRIDKDIVAAGREGRIR